MKKVFILVLLFVSFNIRDVLAQSNPLASRVVEYHDNGCASKILDEDGEIQPIKMKYGIKLSSCDLDKNRCLTKEEIEACK